MDLWVVAAAAGAGYLAKYLSKERETEGLSESFSGGSTHDKSELQPLLQQLRERACFLQRLSGRQLGENATSSRDSAREDISSNSGLRLSEANGSAGASATEMASTSGFGDEASLNLRVYEEYNILSLSSLPPGLPGKNNYEVDGIEATGEVCDKSEDFFSSEPSTREKRFYNRHSRSRTSLRSRRLHRYYSIKPLSSLESCAAAQLYKEHVEMDEYVFTRLSSPTAPTLRPLLVTDGKQIISRANGDFYRVKFGTVENMVQEGAEAYAEGEVVLGIPPLPEIGSVELPKKLKQRRGKGHLGRSGCSNMRVSPKNFQSQGSPNGMLLFCIGIAIGVVSTVMTNKREVDRLNEFLKQTENLVQDLQEELEMKDSLTVKELVNEGYGSQENNHFSIHHQPPAPFFPQQELTESINCNGKEPYDQKENEKSEIMSKIEAELEAELERLELSMCSSGVQRTLCGLLELDSDFEADIVKEELKAEMINRGARVEDDSDQNASGTSTTPTHTANYAVSPRELSLRLHKVVQERLEERIMELETALQQSQQRMHLLESEEANSQRDFSNSEIGSSSTHESPTMREDRNNIARPLVLNLSGEALDAYNEAYEVFMRVTGPEEENPPTTVSNNTNIYEEGLHPLNQSEFCHQDRSGQNGSLTHRKIIEDRQSRSRGSSELGDSEDEEDEMGKLLIKKIVEKTKQGSPAVLNVQKMLFSMD
ncbi:uncharacterized protein LOC122655551 isoform X2 [Telopea speciosissima]|uniref:uncharacterized protein LOC122655551 isoform X2 n=1 Tax=Telopea speciosissima TaxID=54955 RepID=UPI001CC51121|nr:uncharacterized protein LOC122655551 isoform X2 [Telopea speciosissima]